MTTPTLQHLMAYILRYLKGIDDYRLWFLVGGEMKLIGYIDADWACDIDDKRSISACCIYLGINLISWSSKKHQ